MTHEEIFGNAKWLCPNGSPEAALFRSVFNCDSVGHTEITICGLGYFELYINDKHVGDDYFVPANSDYHDRPDITLNYPLDDEWTHRIYCMKYDITGYVFQGENIIGVAVGGGFYHQTVREAEGRMNYGDIKLCYKIDTCGKTIVSDENVRYQRGFFESSNLFYGENLNYLGFDRKWNTADARTDGWENTPCVDAPETDFYIQECPTDRIAEVLKPELVKNFGDYSVYKVSKNVSGYPVVRCNKAGETVVIECTEEIHDDMTLNNRSVGYGEQRQIETIITDGANEDYHPYFCWFGFQYFSVTNNAQPVEVRVIYADVKVTSNFSCSDETLNWYYKAFINTQLCNMHGGVPSDCPHRERLGYTGDGQLTCDAVMTEFDAQSFYRKWIDDIYDCQDKTTGHVQHTAPFAGGGGGPAGWGGAVIVVPYTYYRHYGDKDMIVHMYENMALFVKYMESRYEEGLVVREEKDGWCLGDWCAPEKISIPEPFVNTTMYITQLKMMAECSVALGLDSSEYEELIKSHSAAVVKKYYSNGDFLDGIQGSDAFAADCGIGDECLINKLAEKYDRLGEFDTGIFGTYILLNVLFKTGKCETAVNLMKSKKAVSFETMRKAGATTLWENWNGKASHSHPMFGASTQYLFEYILGIRQNDNSIGYDEITISPVFASGLDFARGYITTPHGEISVSWKLEQDKIEVDIRLCDEARAQFCYNEKKFALSRGKNEFTLNHISSD